MQCRVLYIPIWNTIEVEYVSVLFIANVDAITKPQQNYVN